MKHASNSEEFIAYYVRFVGARHFLLNLGSTNYRRIKSNESANSEQLANDQKAAIPIKTAASGRLVTDYNDHESPHKVGKSSSVFFNACLGFFLPPP